MTFDIQVRDGLGNNLFNYPTMIVPRKGEFLSRQGRKYEVLSVIHNAENVNPPRPAFAVVVR